MAFWTRFVTIRSSSSAEPLVWAAPPVTSERDPALFGEGQERFGGFFRDEGQVDVFVAKFPRSPRLSSRRASVRSIARVLAACRRSMSSSRS